MESFEFILSYFTMLSKCCHVKVQKCKLWETNGHATQKLVFVGFVSFYRREKFKYALNIRCNGSVQFFEEINQNSHFSACLSDIFFLSRFVWFQIGV